MRTSTDAYHRLLHDSSLGLADISRVGYHDRFRGAMEKPLRSFNTHHAEVPWHRVLYLRAGSQFLWHKSTRFDAVFHSTDMEAAQTPHCKHIRQKDLEQALENAAEDEENRLLNAHVPGRTRAPDANAICDKFRPVPIHLYNTALSQWIAVDSLPSQEVPLPQESTEGMLSVAALNVFHPREYYESDPYCVVLCSEQERWDSIIDTILHEKPMFWVFSEATTKFARYISGNVHVRGLYNASDSPVRNFATLPSTVDYDATGMLLLIRRDVAVPRVLFHEPDQKNGKRFLFVEGKLPNNGPTVIIAAVHLTAGPLGKGATLEAASRRRKQLKFVMDCLDRISASREGVLQVIAGDFNFCSSDDDTVNDMLEPFIEAPAGLQKNTFDPQRNTLAALSSNGIARRTDRIYVRYSQPQPSTNPVAVKEHRLLCEETFPVPETGDVDGSLHFPSGLFASDHFGVLSCFQTRSASKSTPAESDNKELWTTSMALTLLPDGSTQEEISEWLKIPHDVSQGKWPPHLNVLFPFVVPELLPVFKKRFADLVRLAGGEQAPSVGRRRTAALVDVSSFRHPGISTVFLRPDECTNSALKRLHALALQAAEEIAGPMPIFKGRPVGWNPHLTVARLRNADENVPEFVRATRSRFIAEKKRDAWVLPLSNLTVLQKGGGRMQEIDYVPVRSVIRGGSVTASKTLRFVSSLARRVFNGSNDFRLLPVGSAVLLRDYAPVRDLDVVLIPPGDCELSCTASQFAAIASEKLKGARPGAVRLADDAICPIVELGGMMETHGVLPVDIMYGNTEAARDAIFDMRAFKNKLDKLVEETTLDHQHLATGLGEVKRWAEAKMLTGRGYTLFSGVAWTTMMFAAVSRAIEEQKVDLDNEDEIILDLLEVFFNTYAEFDFSNKNIAIDGFSNVSAWEKAHGPMIAAFVLTPTSRHNATRRVSSGVVQVVQAEMRSALETIRRARTSSGLTAWESYRSHALSVDSILRVHPTNIVVVITGIEASFVVEVDGWLRGRFAQFANKDLGQDRGIWLRPASKLEVASPGVNETTISVSLTCGICESTTIAPVHERRQLVSQAAAELNDRFLRWNMRPAETKLRVLVKRGCL